MTLYITNYKELYSLDDIKRKLELNELKTKYIVKKLSENGFIQLKSIRLSTNQTKSGYGLTDKGGENFLVENNYIE